MIKKISISFCALIAMSSLQWSSAFAGIAQYFIQVGVFTSETNASRLGKRLATQDFHSTIQQITLPDGRIAYKLLIGPYPDRKESEQAREQLKNIRVTGFIRTFEPVTEGAQTPPTPTSTDTTSMQPEAPAETPHVESLDIDAPDNSGTALTSSWQLSGHVAIEGTFYNHSSSTPQRSSTDTSIVVQPEFYYAWNDDKESITITPFLRIDQQDKERSHHDIRELLYQKASHDWELKAGISKVFWGVTESQHLVDIINQTDLIEDPDGEEKLGQPMVNLTYITDTGAVDLFLLPYFRERTFPGENGRLRTAPRIDTDQTRYESSHKEKHIDAAVRWITSYGNWDIGLSHFYGTSREPSLIPGTDSSGASVLIPYYEIIQQTGTNIQTTRDSWLWKLELIRRQGQGNTYTAATAGFEYTFYGVAGTATDVGAILEYLYDDRGDAATTIFEDDVMLGARVALNDTQSTEILLGAIVDMDSSTRAFSLEASRRIGDAWKLSAEGRSYSNISPSSPLHGLQYDDYIQLELARFF